MKRTAWISRLCTLLISAQAWELHADEAMKLAPSHALAKVLRTSEQTAGDDSVLSLDGALGETVSGQVVVLPGDVADTVRSSMSDLKLADGTGTISAKAVRLQWVRYLDLTTNSLGVPKDELIAAAPVSVPDAFWEEAERPIEAKMPQPLWIEVDVPTDAPPGNYQGTLTVNGRDAHADLSVSLRVRNFQLPQERHQHVIQWWSFPGRGFDDLKPGTEAYWQHLTRCCEFVKRYRQTDVQVSWALIEQKADDKNAKHWDTALFEQYAETVFKTGLRAVQFPGMARHTKFQLEQDSRTEAPEESIERLAALQDAVVKHNWQGRVLVSLADEPFIYQEQSFRVLLDRVHKIAPAVKVIEAVESEDFGDLDVYVPKLSHLNLWWPHFEELVNQHKEVWFYTCCHPQGRYPNRFLDEPLVKARELHWISYLYGLDGYLHWGLNWFAKDGDPYSEAGRNPWPGLPPGDSQVAYPGKEGWLGSLRLSTMRDGLQDYEYLWTLEERYRALKQRLGEEARWLNPRQRPRELCRQVVQSFYEHTRDPQILLATRAAIASEIEAMSTAPLLVVQTSPPDGTITPAGPIMINIRGVTTPGATVTVNGRPIIAQNVSPAGCFIDAQFISADNPQIAVTAELNGQRSTAKRSFRVVGAE